MRRETLRDFRSEVEDELFYAHRVPEWRLEEIMSDLSALIRDFWREGYSANRTALVLLKESGER